MMSKQIKKRGPVPDRFDYKDTETLQRFLTAQGRLHSAKRSGLKAAQQRSLKRAVKYSRYLALLPYTSQ